MGEEPPVRRSESLWVHLSAAATAPWGEFLSFGDIDFVPKFVTDVRGIDRPVMLEVSG